MANTMHVFEMDRTHWIVASDIDDAWDVLEEVVGESREDYPESEMAMLPDGGVLTVLGEVEDEQESMTHAEWAAREGRGLLASTEY